MPAVMQKFQHFQAINLPFSELDNVNSWWGWSIWYLSRWPLRSHYASGSKHNIINILHNLYLEVLWLHFYLILFHFMQFLFILFNFITYHFSFQISIQHISCLVRESVGRAIKDIYICILYSYIGKFLLSNIYY